MPNPNFDLKNGVFLTNLRKNNNSFYPPLETTVKPLSYLVKVLHNQC